MVYIGTLFFTFLFNIILTSTSRSSNLSLNALFGTTQNAEFQQLLPKITTQMQRIDCRVTRQPAVQRAHSKHTTLHDADSSKGQARRCTIRNLERCRGEGRNKRRRKAHVLHGSLIIRSRHPEESSRFAWPFAPQVMTPTLALSVLTGQYLSRYDRIKFMRSLYGAGQWTRTMAALLHATVYCSPILIIKCK